MSFLKYVVALLFIFAIAAAPVYAQKGKDKEIKNPCQKEFNKLDELYKKVDNAADDAARTKIENEIKKTEKFIEDEFAKRLKRLEQDRKRIVKKQENNQKKIAKDPKAAESLQKDIDKLKKELDETDEKLDKYTEWSKYEPPISSAPKADAEADED